MTVTPETSEHSHPKASHRLSYDVRPSRYELVLEPDLVAGTFSGHVAISLDIVETVATIELNSAGLQIGTAIVVRPEGHAVEVKVTIDAEGERLILHLPSPMEPGPARVDLAFDGVLGDDLRGFYRSTYTDDQGQTRTVAVTQFEAPHARRAFPCWDEPDRKAVFAVTLVIAKGLDAVANGGIVEESRTADGRRRLRFADTIPMSSYLVCFVVGELEATSPVDVDGVAVRIVHIPGKGHLTGFAIDVARHALRWYTEYFAIPYPGDKLDLIAVPDFAFGAMENLGAVTFREVLLLVDEATVSTQELSRVCDVICHEIAHMWFGDLVTMGWWNGIWLNEAFATFMEIQGNAAFRPDWHRWDEFSLERSAAFDIDALESSRPVEYPVITPEDAEGMFDVLTYQKGGALVRMLEQYLTPDVFREGIRLYMQRHRYANTETVDLWDALETASGVQARRIMDGWIYRPGFPEVAAERSADGRTLRLSQRRFLYVRDVGGVGGVGGGGAEGAEAGGSPAGPGDRWAVPVIVRSGSADGSTREHRVVLEGPEAVVDLDGQPSWLVVNAGSHGFYRVTYSADLRECLATNARTALSTVERYTLLDDTFAAVVAGSIAASEYLGLVEAMASDDDPVVWRAILAGLGQISRLVDDEALAALRAFLRRIAAPHLATLGWETGPSEPETRRTLRRLVIGAMGGFGADPDVRLAAAEWHARSLAEPATVDPDVVAACVDVVAAGGGESEFAAHLDRYRSAATPQDEQRYLYALGDFDHPALVRRALDLAFSGEVRAQSGPFLIGRALANRTQGRVAWDVVRERWPAIIERFAPALVARNVIGALRIVADAHVADQLRSLVTEHPLPAAMKTVEQALDRQAVGITLKAREQARLRAYLLAESR